MWIRTETELLTVVAFPVGHEFRTEVHMLLAFLVSVVVAPTSLLDLSRACLGALTSLPFGG